MTQYRSVQTVGLPTPTSLEVVEQLLSAFLEILFPSPVIQNSVQVMCREYKRNGKEKKTYGFLLCKIVHLLFFRPPKMHGL